MTDRNQKTNTPTIRAPGLHFPTDFDSQDSESSKQLPITKLFPSSKKLKQLRYKPRYLTEDQADPCLDLEENSPIDDSSSSPIYNLKRRLNPHHSDSENQFGNKRRKTLRFESDCQSSFKSCEIHLYEIEGLNSSKEDEQSDEQRFRKPAQYPF